MKYYADLHIHSHYSRATSKDLDLEHLNLWAQLKGINVVGTGDFVHPKWLAELEEKLEPAEEGFYKLKKEFAQKNQTHVPDSCRADVRFVLTVEISNIYKRHEKVRKVHNLIWAPDFETAKKIQLKLAAIGNIKSDGRPILGLDSKNLLEIALESHPMSLFVPAHIWTPWFSALGSKGGFNSMEEAFGDLKDYIYAVETGLSSDPLMNWRLKQLDNYILVSNSDAHSAPKLGREANLFDTEFSYRGIYNALRNKDDKGLVSTIEFFPEEGKYHYDGHRDCKTRMHPRETIKNKGLCPVCSKPVTVGVMARIEELADRPENERSSRWRPYQNVIPLPEIVAEAKGSGVNSKGVQQMYQQMLSSIGNEFYILMDASIEEIGRYAGEVMAESISRMRKGEVSIASGYDGEYGTIKIYADHERKAVEGQLALF